MSTRRRTSTLQRPQPAPATPAPPPRERFVPAWDHRRYSDIQHSSHSLASWISMVQDGTMRLPRFQRPWVWTDEQIVRLFDSFITGYHCGTMLVWEQYRPPPSVERFGEIEVLSDASKLFGVLLVVDGQQRLVSIVTAALSGRFWIDLDAGAVTSAPGPWRAPAGHFITRGSTGDLIHWIDAHVAEHGLSHDRVCSMQDLMNRVYVGAVRLGSDWTLDRVMESFRRLNTEGTPIDADQLAAALELARDGAPAC